MSPAGANAIHYTEKLITKLDLSRYDCIELQMFFCRVSLRPLISCLSDFTVDLAGVDKAGVGSGGA